jgi:hypothetical protein
MFGDMLAENRHEQWANYLFERYECARITSQTD